MAKKTLRRFLEEARAIDDEDGERQDLKKKAISFAIKSESDGRIKAMVNQIKSQPEVALSEWDKDPLLLNTLSGTLDLSMGKLREHRKRDYMTRMVPIEYDEEAKCQNWLAFLDKIFMGDKSMVDFVQRSIGYSLTGSQKEQCFYMLCGGGANGKTTFLNTIKMITGDYADTLRSSSLMARQYDDGARGDLAKLAGKRFVTAAELNEGQYFDESLLKYITGGETISVRFLYGEEFDLVPQFKLWMGTNEKPRIRGTGYRY